MIPILRIIDKNGNVRDITAIKGKDGKDGEVTEEFKKLAATVEINKNITSGYKSDCIGLRDECQNIKDSIPSLLVNTPEFYTKETLEGMYAISGMKHGDMCIILSNDTTAQSIYRYYTKDISGNELSAPQWLWVTDLSLFAPQPVLEITDNVWDFSKGNTARMTVYASSDSDSTYPDEGDDGWMDGIGGDDDIIQTFSIVSNPNITILNVYSGAFGVLDVYGGGEVVLPDNSYLPPPDWDYLKPEANQHYRYSFYYDGTKFDWNRSVRNDF